MHAAGWGRPRPLKLAPVRLRSVLVATFLLLVAACGDSSQGSSSSQAITIGAIYPLSGPQAPGGKEELGGVQAALQLAQAQGVLDRRVQLRIIDATRPAQASAAVDQLVQQAHVPAILGTYGYFMGSFYFGLILLWLLLIGAAFLAAGGRTRLLIRYIRDPIVLAFSTASSEAAFPRTLEALDRFGVPPRIASFVLPLGYSFNLDGSMMYMTFATLFIAQAYQIHLSLGQEIAMLLMLMLTSKGMAGVPRASLVVIAATMSMFRIPEAGLLLILAVDHFLDMGRSATNVVGNAVASSVVARWEGGLDMEESPDVEPRHAPSHVTRTGKVHDHF